MVLLMDSLTLNSSTGAGAAAAARKAPETYREEVNCLASWQGLGGAAFSQTEELAETIVPLLSSPPTQLHTQVGAISESLEAQLRPFALPW